jgi:hypothetical protein
MRSFKQNTFGRGASGWQKKISLVARIAETLLTIVNAYAHTAVKL